MPALRTAVIWVARQGWRAVRSVFRLWRADLAKRKTFGGKAVSIGVGLLALCLAWAIVAAGVRGAGEAVGIVPTRTPIPTQRPTAVEVDPTDAPAPTPSEVPTVIYLVTAQANARIIDPGDLTDDDSKKLGIVCPGDTVAILKRGIFWNRVQVVTTGPDCGTGHAVPGQEGWVAFQNIQMPTATPEPTHTPIPTRLSTATPEPGPTTAPARPTIAPAPAAQPVATRAPQPTAKPPSVKHEGVPGTGGYDCPPGYPVKGNQSGIYHTPASRYYTRTKPEWCFASADDAAAAGFRPPKQ